MRAVYCLAGGRSCCLKEQHDSRVQRAHLGPKSLDISALDAIAWSLQWGYAPPPPVAEPEGVNTLRRAPCENGGPFFMPIRLPHIAPHQ